MLSEEGQRALTRQLRGGFVVRRAVVAIETVVGGIDLYLGRAASRDAVLGTDLSRRRIVAFEARAWQDDPAKPIASAFGHFKLKRPADADEDGLA